MANVYSKIVAIACDFVGDFSFPKLTEQLPPGVRITPIYNFATATQFSQDVTSAMKRSEVILVDTSDHTLRLLKLLDVPYLLIYPTYNVSEMEQRHVNNCRLQSNCIHLELKRHGDFERLQWDYRPDQGVSALLPSA